MRFNPEVLAWAFHCCTEAICWNLFTILMAFYKNCIFPTPSVCQDHAFGSIFYLSKIPKPFPTNRRRSWPRAGQQAKERSLKTKTEALPSSRDGPGCIRLESSGQVSDLLNNPKREWVLSTGSRTPFREDRKHALCQGPPVTCSFNCTITSHFITYLNSKCVFSRGEGRRKNHRRF